MERIRHTISEFFSNRKVQLQEKERREQREEVWRHTHNLGCKRAGKINQVNQQFAVDMIPVMGHSLVTLLSYETECSECGKKQYYNLCTMERE
jgi:hypothetical protein